MQRYSNSKLKIFKRVVRAGTLLFVLFFVEEIALGFELENEYVKYVIDASGCNSAFVDKRTGKDYLATKSSAACAKVRIAGQYHDASSASYSDGKLTIGFGETGVKAVVKAVAEKHYLTLEVISLDDASADGKVEAKSDSLMIAPFTETVTGRSLGKCSFLKSSRDALELKGTFSTTLDLEG